MTWYIDAGPAGDFIVSSRIRIARNLRGYPFPNRLDPDQSRHLMAPRVVVRGHYQQG